MRKEEITAMARSFADAVNIARESGFDAVEVHAGHGYLISQFLSPSTNHRHDEYGGTLDDRMRFMKEMMTSVMEAAAADMAVIVKMNMRDGFRGGMEIPESLVVAKTLEAMGVHALVLSGGFVSKAPMYVMRGTMPIRTMSYYMDGFWLKNMIRFFGGWMVRPVPFTEAYFFDDAKIFRKELKLPLIYVGGLLSREKIDEVLDAGFEFVSFARALLQEPGFIARLQKEEGGRSACTHANYCIARMYSREMACHQHLNDIPNCLLKEINKLGG
jgi:2,4-dienoyl-CoA reductase-like NADH-dependent reductase (Old Yellow Enzyme family)